MTEKQLDDLLLAIRDDQLKMQEDNKKRDEMLESLKDDVSMLKEDVSMLKEDVSMLKEDVSMLKKDNISISRSVAVIEQKHGEKIQAIYDGYKGFLSKFDSVDDKFKSHEERLDHHMFEINNLKSQKIANS